MLALNLHPEVKQSFMNKISLITRRLIVASNKIGASFILLLV
jgi:hypothetical protein